MNDFAGRMGHKSITPVQRENISEALRERSWSIINDDLGRLTRYASMYGEQDNWVGDGPGYITKVWDQWFKLSTARITWNAESDKKYIRKEFFSYDWLKFYGFIEFFVNLHDRYYGDQLIAKFNRVFKEECSAFTFKEYKIIDEMPSVEVEAIENSSDLSAEILEHICKSSNFYFQQNPDYDNCIKEAVSAIESYMKMDSGLLNKTLGQIIADYENRKQFSQIDTHSQLAVLVKEIMQKTYNYSNDIGGARHANADGKYKATKEDAWFVLVLSSLVINFMKNAKPDK